jgi:hypothetical protein
MQTILHIFTIVGITIFSYSTIFAQAVPSEVENIEYLMTFGNKAEKKWGDDDFIQIYFFAIPVKQTNPIYIRVFDPDCDGALDQINNQFNTKTRFTIFGGKGCYSNKDARKVDPSGNFKSGLQLCTKTFSNQANYDNKWYTFGPFNPKEGEYDKQLNCFIFKIVVEGIDGDDGNTYKFYLSQKDKSNVPVEGGNAFAYEVCFRLQLKSNETSHFYLFADKDVVSINQQNFDFDKDGDMRLTTISKKNHLLQTSGDDEWKGNLEKITKPEQNTSLDLQITKKSTKANDMVLYLTNQYNEAIPFFTVPIGGIPRYKYKVDVSMQLPE